MLLRRVQRPPCAWAHYDWVELHRTALGLPPADSPRRGALRGRSVDQLEADAAIGTFAIRAAPPGIITVAVETVLGGAWK